MRWKTLKPKPTPMATFYSKNNVFSVISHKGFATSKTVHKAPGTGILEAPEILIENVIILLSNKSPNKRRLTF